MLEKSKNMTIAEMVEFRDFSVAVFSIPEIRPEDDAIVEVFSGLSNGKRHDAVMAKVYDAEIAELLCDHLRSKELHKKHRAGQAYRGRKPENRERYRWNMKCMGEECGNSIARNYHRDRSMRKDFDAELRQHEDAIADYYDLATWKQWHENAKDALLDEDITKTSICGIFNEIAYENARIDQLNTEMLNILKGECY